MSQDLTGRVAVVTGSTSGLGRATALRLAEDGAKVIVNSHEPGQGAETVAEIEAQDGEALFVQGDVSSMSDCENLARKTLQAFGTISILVNNAGIERRGGVVNTVEQDWDDMVNVIPIRRPGTW